jgi:hypothetical protein
MISVPLLLSLAALQSAPIVEEVRLPGVEGVTAQAVVALPQIGPKDRAALLVLLQMLSQAPTKTYANGQIRNECLGGGDRFRLEIGPDHLRIGVASDRTIDALALLYSVLYEPVLSREAFAPAVEAIQFRPREFWENAIRPERPALRLLRFEDVEEAHRRFFVPSRIAVGVAGEISPGEALGNWAARIAGWQEPRLRPFAPDRGETEMRGDSAGPVSLVEFRGPDAPGSEAVRLMALTLLGTGKTSALFRTVREAEGLSYWHEAVLVPTVSGWQTRILLPMKAKRADLPERADRARRALLEDIDRWDDARIRLGAQVARAAFADGLHPLPILLSGSRALGHETADRAYLAAYWRRKTGARFDVERLLATMASLPAAAVRQAAIEAVATGDPVILP